MIARLAVLVAVDEQSAARRRYDESGVRLLIADVEGPKLLRLKRAGGKQQCDQDGVPETPCSLHPPPPIRE